MKTILFFDRCELTNLYIHLTAQLKDKFNIIHVAFSDVEATQLNDAGINNYYHYTNIFEKYLDEVKVNDDLLQELDSMIIKSSEGRFNLNSSIQSDRGFSILQYQEALLLAVCHYVTWKEIFRTQNVNLMCHEVCSQFMVHIAALLCKEQGGDYRYFVQCASDCEGYNYINVDGENFESQELTRKFHLYLEHPEQIDIKRVKHYLEKFRKDFSVFLESEAKPSISKSSIIVQAIHRWLTQKVISRKFNRLKNNIDYWMAQNNEPANRLRNIHDYKRHGVRFETKIPKEERYYYYSIHLEPEATVLYLGDGIYQNQVKLIQNIAAALPAGTYLYVKDHPHEYAYRDACDYERLMKVPNIRLFHQSISGKKLMKNAIGVFSINGTAGFEALLLGKQVYCFGNCYYAIQPRVNYIRNIRDARISIYNNIGKKYTDDMALFAFLNAFLESVHPGFVSYFSGRADKLKINHTENAKAIAFNLVKEFES